MPTKQKAKPKQRQHQWTNVSSVTVVKNLVRSSISQICYLRSIFPEDCFAEKKYTNGLHIKALVPAVNRIVDGEETCEVGNEKAWKLTRWLEEGVFEALEKQYLKKMTFGVFTDDGDASTRTLVESYCYDISYPEAGKACVSVGISGNPDDQYSAGTRM